MEPFIKALVYLGFYPGLHCLSIKWCIYNSSCVFFEIRFHIREDICVMFYTVYRKSMHLTVFFGTNIIHIPCKFSSSSESLSEFK